MLNAGNELRRNFVNSHFLKYCVFVQMQQISEVVYYNETCYSKRYKGLNRFFKHRLGNNEQFLLQVQILDEI